ncbi:hypothetical protein MLD38_038597 [Melastoma candidum]|uniref:Uncharacterized protein n=1 Tax=Melastoma candidum TaxID=119954 RepID=A0ACB9L053_9MYRT|nr:hypothetical protein MLD38_038597 [Melastoma candidum]
MSVAEVALSPAAEDSVLLPGFCHYSRVDPHRDESILIYLMVAGSVNPLRVLESDSIASVKLRIQTSEGFGVKRQKLVYGGRELSRSNSTVKDYGIKGGNVLHLVLQLSDLLVVTVTTVSGKEFELHVDRHQNVAYLKQRVAKLGKGFVDFGCQELFCDREKLEDRRLIHDVAKDKDAVIHLMIEKSAKVRAKPVQKGLELSVEAGQTNKFKKYDDDFDIASFSGESQMPSQSLSVEPVISNPCAKLPPALWNMIKETFAGLSAGHSPIRSAEGTGGTYFMRDSSGRNYVSVFKPMDEEPNAPNNHRGLLVSPNGEGLKRGTRVGEGAIREVAAFLLDHPRIGPRSLTGELMGFSGVPPTIMARCLHEGFNHPNGYNGESKDVKVGSLQMFFKNCGSCEDVGPGNFPVEEVHKISVLDIRMANADRHSGNILISKGDDGKTVLIPIDHGYCLPETFEDCTFDWLYWPQAREPYSSDTIDYIRSLDAEQDIALLKYYGWDVSPDCACTLRVSTMLLKKGVERGLTPFAIGSIMCRETINEESVIEGIIREAEKSLLPGMSEAAFLDMTSQIMDSTLDKLGK